MRCTREEKYVAVKSGIWLGVRPAYALRQFEEDTPPRTLDAQGDALSWEIRLLEEAGFSAGTLIDQAYRLGIPWVEENTPAGRAWVWCVAMLAAGQINELFQKLDEAFPTGERPAPTVGDRCRGHLAAGDARVAAAGGDWAV
jgi:hypothetical protein